MTKYVCLGLSIFRVVFNIADKKKIGVNYFFENYIYAKSHKNR